MKVAYSMVVAGLMLALRGESCASDGPLPEPARAADSLVDSIGVATHFPFRDSMYCTHGEAVQKLLGELGVRYIRDSLAPQQEQLWKKYGLRVIAIDNDPEVPWEKKVAQWKANRHLLAAIEGPNEVNGGWKKLNKTYLGNGWPEGPKEFQVDLYKTIKEEQELQSLPVIALSTAYKGDGRKLAPLRDFDFANTHSYPAGALPSASLDFGDPILLMGRDAVSPPLVATETGYHTCLGNDEVIAGFQSGVSHVAQGKYLPRLIAEYFNSGFRWTVLYEFGAGRPNKAEQEDPEAAFGLLTPDANPKPAYFALQDLIALLSESRWDATGRQWQQHAPFAPQALSFALRGAPESLHHTLLQRSDGTFQLLLWNEVSSFDRNTKSDISNKEVPVRLILDRKAEKITVSRLGKNRPVPEKFTDTREVDLLVPDEVLIVEIKLAEPQRPAALEAPKDIAATSGPTTITLSWPATAGVDAWWVSLNGRNLGSARRETDGRASFEVKGLLPATTYPLEIVAAARDGGVSAPAKIAVATENKFPDLVVRSLQTIPSRPKEGDAVQFLAVIANKGDAPTEAGTVVGVKFSVDGKVLSWSDVLRGPLAPGQAAEVRPTGGIGGWTTWTLPRGTHRITALVDDARRIGESDEDNNILSVDVNGAPEKSEPPQ